jgi:hypothetical protein
MSEAIAALPHENKPDPVASAKAIIAAERQRRVKECGEKIDAILKEYGVALNIVPARIELVPVND